MLMPTSYAINDGQSAPEGTVEKSCKYCHAKFAIPAAEVDNYKEETCEDCKEHLNNDIAAASAALMKNPSDAADAINKALGK